MSCQQPSSACYSLYTQDWHAPGHPPHFPEDSGVLNKGQTVSACSCSYRSPSNITS